MQATPLYHYNSTLANTERFWLGSKTRGDDLSRGSIDRRMRQQRHLLLRREVQCRGFGYAEPCMLAEATTSLPKVIPDFVSDFSAAYDAPRFFTGHHFIVGPVIIPRHCCSQRSQWSCFVSLSLSLSLEKNICCCRGWECVCVSLCLSKLGPSCPPPCS